MTPAQEVASKLTVAQYIAVRNLADMLLHSTRARDALIPAARARAEELDRKLAALTPDEQAVLDTMALQCVVCKGWHSTEVVAGLSKC